MDRENSGKPILFSSDMNDSIRTYVESYQDAPEKAPWVNMEELARNVVDRLHMTSFQTEDGEKTLRLMGPETFFESLNRENPEIQKAVVDVMTQQLMQNDEATRIALNYGDVEAYNNLTNYMKKEGLLEKPESCLILHDADYSDKKAYVADKATNPDRLLALCSPSFPDIPVIIRDPGKDPFFTVHSGSHETYTIVPESWIKRAMESPLKERIQESMDNGKTSSEIRDFVYQSVPSLYEGKELSRALRDAVVDRLSKASDDQKMILAEKILGFTPSDCQAFCERECGLTVKEQKKPDYPKNLFWAARKEMNHYLDTVTEPLRVFPVEEILAVTSALEKKSPQEAGSLVENLTQPGQEKALKKLVKAYKKLHKWKDHNSGR